MKIAIMQPYIFPYIGYFQLVNAVDKFVFYDDVAFIKQGWINRNNILLKGQKYRFTIPLKNVSSFRAINETYISERPSNWEDKLLSTLRQAYSKAAFFHDVFPLVENVISSSSNQTISVAAKNSILRVIEYLGIKTRIGESSSGYGNGRLKGEKRVIDICRQEHAATYVNLLGGLELYDGEHFSAMNIGLVFLEPVCSPYRQFDSEFVPSLSIIDVLMFNSVDEVGKMLGCCRII